MFLTFFPGIITRSIIWKRLGSDVMQSVRCRQIDAAGKRRHNYQLLLNQELLWWLSRLASLSSDATLCERLTPFYVPDPHISTDLDC
jgi:hypothetical protein